MGAGGIGSFLGGMLANHGADVTLICRGQHLAAIRRDGLHVRSAKRNFSVARINATAAPADENAAHIPSPVCLKTRPPASSMTLARIES